MKVPLGDFHAKFGKENIFKRKIGNESLYHENNDNGVRIINFATMFQHQNIHKYTWNSPDGKTHNQVDHIMMDRRQHSSILDVIFFRGANCDTNHYLVVAKFTERLAVSKQAAQKFDVERFNLRKLNEMDVRQQNQIEITNRVAALENLSDREDINRA